MLSSVSRTGATLASTSVPAGVAGSVTCRWWAPGCAALLCAATTRHPLAAATRNAAWVLQYERCTSPHSRPDQPAPTSPASPTFNRQQQHLALCKAALEGAAALPAKGVEQLLLIDVLHICC